MMGPVDKLLCFGECSLVSAADLPDTVNVGESQTERMGVSVQVTEDAAGGTSIALTLKGSDDNSNFTSIDAKTVSLAALVKGANFHFPIPYGTNYKYYKVVGTKTGTFTAGKLTAYIDTYMGI